MEEWHQKLHNNTSPDDVVICQALIAYLEHDLDISRYWATLQVCLCKVTKLICVSGKEPLAASLSGVEHAALACAKRSRPKHKSVLLCCVFQADTF